MLRALSRTLLIFLFFTYIPPLSAQDNGFDIGEMLCPEDQLDLDAGDDYSLKEELPLVMMAAFVHINRSNAGEGINADQGCVLGTVELEGEDEIIIFKYLDISGKFASRYQFVLLSEIETDNIITLNTFSDVDAVAHELELIPTEVRLYHLDAFSPNVVATHALFAGEPSVNELMRYIMSILNGESTPAVTVDMSGEETSIAIREDLLEDEEETPEQ